MSERRFYRKVFKYEILSSEPLYHHLTLEEIYHQVTKGHMVLNILDLGPTEEISGPRMAKLLTKFDEDSEDLDRFMLSPKGDDTEEWKNIKTKELRDLCKTVKAPMELENLVHEVALDDEVISSAVNAGGVAAQIKFLMEQGMTPEEILECRPLYLK